MRFKLFVVCALACGFMAYVLANENVSTEVEDQVKKVPAASKSPKIDEAAELVELLEVPKNPPPPPPPAVKKVEKPTVPVVPAQKVVPAVHTVAAPAPAQKLVPAAASQRLLPVASSRGTDDILTVAGLKPQPKSGALIMPHEDYYMAELYDVDANGVNWGK